MEARKPVRSFSSEQLPILRPNLAQLSPIAEQSEQDLFTRTRGPSQITTDARDVLSNVHWSALEKPVRFRSLERKQIVESLENMSDRVEALEAEIRALRRLLEAQQHLLQMTKRPSELPSNRDERENTLPTVQEGEVGDAATTER